MKSLKVGLFTFAGALFAIACASPAPETTNRAQAPVAASPVASANPDSLATARANFEKHCTGCHGDRGEAGLVKIGDKRLKVPALTKGPALTHTDEQLARQITNGDDEMPAFKDKLTAEEINLLVNYIRKEFQGK
ncbi:MAG: cytochrome c [Acidobacteriota bacterium]